MTQAKWAVRIYLPFEEDKTIEFVGSFENAGKRYLDDIIVFSGIYGVPDYMLWYIHKDMLAYNFSSYSLELKLFLGGDPESCYFQDNYRIIDVGDDLKSDRKVVYAIQEDYAKLDTLLIEFDVSTLEYNQTRTVEQLLTDVIENTGVFPVIFCEHSDPLLQSEKFEYPSFVIESDWTVRDFIQYVADENSFEWTIKYGILFIGPELYTYKDMKASKEQLNRQVDNISKNYWNMKITWSASPLNVLYYYELIDEEKLTDMRCVWAKHWVGGNGDVTKGCFIPIGRTMDKGTYFDSLEGNRERIGAVEHLFNTSKHHQMRVGRITKDEGDTQFADEITLEKDMLQWNKKIPRNMVMNTLTPLFTIPKIGRTTPYLDYQAGLFFPRANSFLNNPNQLVFSPYNRIEQAVLGPYVMGNGSPSFLIPAKDPDDFRFQLPDGFCVYKKKDDFLLMQLLDTPYATVPTQDNTKIHIWMDKDGNIRLNQDATTYIEIDKDKNIKIHQSDDAIIEIDQNGQVTIQKDTNNKITIDSSGNIDTKSESNTTLTVGGVGKIDATGNAVIEGASVLLGDSATLGIVRLNDQIMSTIAEDSAYWGYWITVYTAFLGIWQTALAALVASAGTPAGVVAYGTAMIAAVTTLQTGIPSSLTGKTTAASSKCKSE